MTPRKRGMPVARFAALDELNSALEVVDDLLKPSRVPPLGGEIVLAAGDDDPEIIAPTDLVFLDLAHPAFLKVGEMDVAAERRHRDSQAKLVFEVPGISMDEVIRPLVTLVDQVVAHGDRPDQRVFIIEEGEVGVVFPDFSRGGPDVGAEPTGVGEVKVADRGGHHDHIAGTQLAGENQVAGRRNALSLSLAFFGRPVC